MDSKKGNRVVSLDDMDRFISNFQCQRCQSLGSYIMIKELFQWIDESLNISYQCQNCNMSLCLRESNVIEIQTPGCVSKTISRNLIQLARAATEIGLSYSQIESLLQSLGIPSPTLSIWKTSVQIASEGNTSCVSDLTYSEQINKVEHIRNEAQFHYPSAVKTEKPNAVDPPNKSNFIMVKEEPPEVDVKEEVFIQTNDELFMEYTDEVIIPDVIDSIASKSIDQLSRQTGKKGMSDGADTACTEHSTRYNIETIYIEERNSRTSTPENETNWQWNVNKMTQKEILKKRHIMTPKRYRDDFYCEDYRNKAPISFVNKIMPKNRYATKKSSEIDEHLISGINTKKEMETNFNSDFVNNKNSTCNVEIVAESNFDGINCALCGVYKYSKRKHYFFSLIPGFGSITVKVALQILNLTVKKPRYQHICTSCFNFICTKFKFTLRKKIAEQKNIDISEVKLSKIKVRMFEHLDKKNVIPENGTFSNETASSTSSSTMQSQNVVKINSTNEVKFKRKKYLSEKMRESLRQKVPKNRQKMSKNPHEKVVKINSTNEVKFKRKRKKYLSEKMRESLRQKMIKNPHLTKGLKTEAKTSHPLVRLMDISLILPSEAFEGAPVSVNSKSDIFQFCRRSL